MASTVYTCSACGGQICPGHTYRDRWAGANYCPAHAAALQGQAGGIVWRSRDVEPLDLDLPPGAGEHFEFWLPRIEDVVHQATERDDLLGGVVRASLEAGTFKRRVAAEALALAAWAVELPGPGLWFDRGTDAEFRALGLLPREMTTILRDYGRQ